MVIIQLGIYNNNSLFLLLNKIFINVPSAIVTF
jgi:hypothetical protein